MFDRETRRMAIATLRKHLDCCCGLIIVFAFKYTYTALNLQTVAVQLINKSRLSIEFATGITLNIEEYHLLIYNTYSPLKVNRRFGGIYRLHLRARKISRARRQRKSRWQ
jgi:hypothetical protein